MSFSTNNFTGSIQPQLGNYLHGSSHFQKNYYSQQTPTYQFFHPAAMAAMAAAAAGYSQFGNRLATGPLNLTSVPGYRSGYGSNEADENRGPYHTGFGQHDNSYASSYISGFSQEKQSAQLPFSSTPAFQSHVTGGVSSTSDLASNHRFMGSTQSGVQPVTSQIITNTMAGGTTVHTSTSRNSRPHGHKAGQSKPKLKKSMNSQELASLKRQEFDELVKARTDKLLSAYTPVSTEPLSGTSSTGFSTGVTGVVSNDSPESPNYKKLIEAVLDAKKSALLRSPSVVAYIETQQRSLAEFKRRTELFCVEAKCMPTSQ